MKNKLVTAVFLTLSAVTQTSASSQPAQESAVHSPYIIPELFVSIGNPGELVAHKGQSLGNFALTLDGSLPLKDAVRKALREHKGIRSRIEDLIDLKGYDIEPVSFFVVNRVAIVPGETYAGWDTKSQPSKWQERTSDLAGSLGQASRTQISITTVKKD